MIVVGGYAVEGINTVASLKTSMTHPLLRTISDGAYSSPFSSLSFLHTAVRSDAVPVFGEYRVNPFLIDSSYNRVSNKTMGMRFAWASRLPPASSMQAFSAGADVHHSVST